MAEMPEEVSWLGLELRYCFETGTVKAAHPACHLAALTGLRRVHHEAQPHGAEVGVRHGERLHLGEETIEVIHLGAPQPDTVVYRWRDRLFTGAAMLVGGLPRAESTAEPPAAVADAVQRRTLALPGETLVFPGRAVGGYRVSTLAQERLTNPELTGTGNRPGPAPAAEPLERSP